MGFPNCDPALPNSRHADLAANKPSHGWRASILTIEPPGIDDLISADPYNARSLFIAETYPIPASQRQPSATWIRSHATPATNTHSIIMLVKSATRAHSRTPKTNLAGRHSLSGSEGSHRLHVDTQHPTLMTQYHAETRAETDRKTQPSISYSRSIWR